MVVGPIIVPRMLCTSQTWFVLERGRKRKTRDAGVSLLHRASKGRQVMDLTQWAARLVGMQGSMVSRGNMTSQGQGGKDSIIQKLKQCTRKHTMS